MIANNIHNTSLFFLLLGLFQIFGYGTFAQAVHISGRVMTEDGAPLESAGVTLFPGNVHTLSDKNGSFLFEVSANERFRLTVSFVGYKAFERTVNLGSDAVVLDKIILKRDNRQLNEVTVRDNYAERRQKEESLNIETVNADYIRRNMGGSLMQSLEKLPGVKTISIGSSGSKPLIRGLGFNQVVVVENGIKHEGQQWGADHGLEIDQYAAGRLEIIKGPSSFIYGSDAIAGAVDIKPAALPSKATLGGAVDLTAKSNNNLFGGSLNLYGRKDRLFFDARVTVMNYGDYRVPADTIFVYDYAVALSKNHLRNTAGSERDLHLSTGYVSDRFQSVFYFSNISTKSGFFANAHGLEPRRVDTDLHDKSARDILLPSQQVSHTKIINRSTFRFAANKLDIELGFQKNFRQEHSLYVNHGYMPPVYPENRDVDQTLERQYDKTVWSVNAKNELTKGMHTITAGVNGELQQNTIGGWGFLIPSFSQTSGGMFLFDKMRLNDQLMIQGAVRFDHGRLAIKEYKDWFVSQTADGENSYLTRAERITRVFSSLNWSAGINYTPGPFILKANAGTSFRMPIAKELAANGVNYHYFRYEKGDPDLSPEKSYQLDIGLGYNRGKWALQVSPYYNYFPNYIYLNPTSQHDYFYGAGNQIFNYAQSKVMRYGSEIQAKYEFLKNWSAQLSGEYLYTRQLSGAKKGYTLPFSPPASALINIGYQATLSETFSDLYVSVDYRLTGRQNNIVPPERQTPSYQLLGFSAGSKVKWGNQHVSFNLQVQNLLNTRYLNHTSFYRLIGLPEAGRNIVLAVKIPFALKARV